MTENKMKVSISIVLSVFVFSVLFPAMLQSFAGQVVVIYTHFEPVRLNNPTCPLKTVCD